MILLGKKSIVITGAGSGIGRAISFTLAKAGACVGVTDLRLGWVQSVADEIGRLNGPSINVNGGSWMD